MHLGMSGSLRVVPADTPYLKHDHCRLRSRQRRSLRLNDPRRFGSVHWHEGPPEATGCWRIWVSSPGSRVRWALSEDPGQRAAACGEELHHGWQGGRGRGQYLRERSAVSGRHPSHGSRPADHTCRLRRACGRIRHVLGAAIQMGGTTLRDFVNQDGNPGYFKQSLNVYDRAGEPCPVCASVLTGIRLGQRATVFCPKMPKGSGF